MSDTLRERLLARAQKLRNIDLHELAGEIEEAEFRVSALQRELDAAKEDRDSWREEAKAMHQWHDRAEKAERELEETRAAWAAANESVHEHKAESTRLREQLAAQRAQ